MIVDYIRSSINTFTNEFHYRMRVKHIVVAILRDFITHDETPMLTDRQNTGCRTNRVNMSKEK